LKEDAAIRVVAQQEPAIRAAWQSDSLAVICLNELEVGHFTIVLAAPGDR
jgi:hypothetical protein